MFTEFLKAHPMRDMLSDRPLALFPTADDRAAWERLGEGRRAELHALAERWRGEEYPVLKATQFMAFARSGSRTAWEAPYFRRRRKLIAMALDACLREDVGSLDAAADGLWMICEESSWVLSAHNAGVPALEGAVLPDVENPVLDLFAGQTAMILSLVCAMLGRRLDDISPLLRRRARLEIERRVLRPFERRDDFWWMGVVRRDLNNWTPWIVSNVMLAAAIWIEDPLRLSGLLERGCGMLDRYLDCLPEDGGCDEGAAYWGMAGGALLDALELLETLTGGKMTFWEDPKLRAILSFPLNVWIGGRWFVNFADCDATPPMYGERLQFAGRRIGSAPLAALGGRFPGSVEDMLDDTPQLWRLLNLLLHPADAAGSVDLPRDVWLESLQMRIVRRGETALVCKGGGNGDSHNHNDVGSFMLYRSGEPVVVDAGNMVYTKKTFSEDRYTLWNTRSMYHNVPLIGGAEQRAGSEYAARDVRRTPDGLSMDIAGAYPPSAGIASALREFCVDGRGDVTLRDDIALSRAEGVEWVFMLRSAPRVNGSALESGGVRIEADAPMEIAVEELPVDDPRMARAYPGSLWRARFVAAAATRHSVRFTLRRAENE